MKLLIVTFRMSKKHANLSRLKSIYKTVQSFLSFRSVRTPAGYLIDDERPILDKMAEYRKRWKDSSGDADGIQMYCFDVTCVDAPTAKMVKDSICSALCVRLRALADYYAGVSVLRDKRFHSTANAAARYVVLVNSIMPCSWTQRLVEEVFFIAAHLKDAADKDKGLQEISALIERLEHEKNTQ